VAPAGWAQLPVLGNSGAHDPSTIIKDGTRYYLFTTGKGIPNKYSTDLRNWTAGPQVLPAMAHAFESTPGAETILEENGIDAEGNEIILRREILSSGKGRVFVNNQPGTVAVLKQLAPNLAIVHAQHESVLAFYPPVRLALLDAAAGSDLGPASSAYRHWSEIRGRIADLEQGEQDKLRQVDLWTYQLKEIESAAPLPGEDQQLETEKRVLANSERILAAALGAYDSLYEGESSAAATVRAAARQVEDLSRFDEKFREHLTSLETARITIEDVATTLRDYADGIDASPERLAEAGAVTSVGSRGDAYDNALAETINGLYKTEVIRKEGPWKNLEDVEFATLTWVDWWNNRRLHGFCGDIPPAEYDLSFRTNRMSSSRYLGVTCMWKWKTDCPAIRPLLKLTCWATLFFCVVRSTLEGVFFGQTRK